MQDLKLDSVALGMTLRYGCMEMKDIYHTFPKNGVLFMQCINIYLCRYGGRVGYVKDLATMVPPDLKLEFRDFIEWMIETNQIVISGKLFFLPERNRVMGFSSMPTADDKRDMKLLRGGCKYLCPFSSQQLSYFISDVIKEMEAPLPYYELNTEMLMKNKYNCQVLDGYVRITRYYLSHCNCKIGFTLDRDILAKILNCKPMYLYYFVKNNPNIYMDQKNNIFCDCGMRRMYGLSEIPSEEEINNVIFDRKDHVRFMNNIKKH